MQATDPNGHVPLSSTYENGRLKTTTDAVGKGTSNPKMLVPLSGAPALASGGKPEVLYMGAEYCPFCATAIPLRATRCPHCTSGL